jgi:hypothetical protein
VGYSNVRLKSLLGILDWSEACGRGVLSSRESVSKCIQVRMSGQPEEKCEGRGAFIAPKGICPLELSETSDKSGSGSDISGQHLWNLASGLDMFGPGT